MTTGKTSSGYRFSQALFNDGKGFIHLIPGDGQRRCECDNVAHGQFKTQTLCKGAVHDDLGLVISPFFSGSLFDQFDP